MKKTLLLFLFLVSLAQAETTAFVNVNVISMLDETVLRNQTVIVEDRRIASIGPVSTLPVPEGSRLVDGTDRYLMPGLFEMHAHIPPTTSASLDRVLALFALNGVTTVRGMLGHSSHLALREAIESRAVFGPRLVTSGPSLNGNSVSGPGDARSKVLEQKAAGYDFIKLHPGLSLPEFDAIADAANSVDMPFAGHVSVSVGLRRALAAGMATIDHLDGYFVAAITDDAERSGGFGGFFDVLLGEYVDADVLDELAAETAESETWNVPTQLLFENVVSAESPQALSQRPEMRFMPSSIVGNWIDAKQQFLSSDYDAEASRRSIALRRQLIRALHDAGAKLLLGSDAPQVFNVPGFSLHRELGILVESGLTPFDALRSGTVNAADYLGLEAGRVVPGYRADLLLVDDDPLADIGNAQRIHGVMLNGMWVSSADRLERLDAFRRDD